ncbi:iron-siderophore ABC transporter substrate-binding protein [Tsukamurella sp. NPDC003166]|uniref:iron-siderophore ABC transporter substrate-binding protein n=1 Tax=Tsukamurella sp. NPDC003166 TaxID=3154444 RepID=UPI0033A94B73
MFTPAPNNASSGFSRQRFLGGALALGGATVLSACGTSTAPSTSGSASRSASASGGPQRVVALSTGHLDYCLALGIVPVGLAVAVSEATDSRGIPDYIKQRFGDRHDLDSIQVVGQRMSPDLEKVAGLKPDLILSNKRADKGLTEKLTGIARTVQTNGGSEQFKADLKIVAEAFGKAADGERLLADYEGRAHAWGQKRGTSDTISLVRGKGDQYLYFGTLALASIVGADAGLTRPPAQQFSDTASRPLSLEQVGLLEADWLFYSFPGGSGDFAEAPLWKKLPAVVEGRAFPVDVDPWFLNASTVAADRVLADMQRFMSA